jgi:hypothetical protein
MQVTIYYGSGDAHLINEVDLRADRERRSRSSVILSILGDHFERRTQLGSILLELEALEKADLGRALRLQETLQDGTRLGELLVREGFVEPQAVDLGLAIQTWHRRNEALEQAAAR